MSPSVYFNVITEGGFVAKFSRKSCFMVLCRLGKSIDMMSEFDGYINNLNVDKIKAINLLSRNISDLPNKVIKYYYEYLFNHKGWKDWVLNKSVSDIIKNGVMVRADIPHQHMISALVAYRMVDEHPNMVTSFYNLCSQDYNFNRDVIFLMSHYLVDNIHEYNSNHHLINKFKHTIDDVIIYSTMFPYPNPVHNKPYNETFKISDIYKYFSQSNPIKRTYSEVEGSINLFLRQNCRVEHNNENILRSLKGLTDIVNSINRGD